MMPSPLRFDTFRPNLRNADAINAGPALIPHRRPTVDQFIIVAPRGDKPSIESLKKVAQSAMSSGKAVGVTDSVQVQNLQTLAQTTKGYDITPQNSADNNQTMFLIGNRMYVRTIGWG